MMINLIPEYHIWPIGSLEMVSVAACGTHHEAVRQPHELGLELDRPDSAL